ncbi:MAG: PorT family protein [Bacteroidales bacterium]|nr:PorT family protein [Bacteroidales bacterium]
MKKFLYIVFMLLTISSGVAKGQAALLVLIFGEKVASEHFYFSLKVGASYSMITNVEEGKNRPAANFGLINNIKLTDRLFLTPEFLPLATRGVKDVPILTTGDPNLDELLVNPSSTDRKLSYIDIPVLLRYQLSERLWISAGPQISFLTGAKDIYNSEPINGAVLTTEIEIKENLASIDLGGVIDISCMLAKPIAGKGVILYLRYNLGFIDMVKDNTGDPRRNSAIQFGAAFPFIEKQSSDN